MRTLGCAEGICLEVEDNGPGIPAPAREAAINRFARGETSMPGTGLGLAIVQEIAALFEAQMSLSEGAEGRGLRVRLTFPAPAAESA
ncbi:sensor histidine kinase [Paracoccus cavernae]|uniref:histidine kinase n=1 Tax=Paracoccus cavernae TaxID=1571207 RepID=A0ABT8DBC2_9RHOB|nr:sensor histidine kinase [Paracoccus cavernae]